MSLHRIRSLLDEAAIAMFRHHGDARCGADWPPGWDIPVIRALNLIAAACPLVSIGQIKEKLGGLRLYVDTPRNADRDDVIRHFINDAESECWLTCDTCGTAGNGRQRHHQRRGWQRLLDQNHVRKMSRKAMTVAALYVATGGCYFDLEGVDPWDEARDARKYNGPHPVVAHPPCDRYGRWAGARIGQDDGCFAAALASVRRWGGVLEHPEGSHAWSLFGLSRPPRSGGWTPADDTGGWTCCVEQGHYGHRARKATWLYIARTPVPMLRWGPSEASIKPRPGRNPVRERRIGAVQRMCRKERAATPLPFRDLLIAIASRAG